MQSFHKNQATQTKVHNTLLTQAWLCISGLIWSSTAAWTGLVVIKAAWCICNGLHLQPSLSIILQPAHAGLLHTLGEKVSVKYTHTHTVCVYSDGQMVFEKKNSLFEACCQYLALTIRLYTLKYQERQLKGRLGKSKIELDNVKADSHSESESKQFLFLPLAVVIQQFPRGNMYRYPSQEIDQLRHEEFITVYFYQWKLERPRKVLRLLWPRQFMLKE